MSCTLAPVSIPANFLANFLSAPLRGFGSRSSPSSCFSSVVLLHASRSSSVQPDCCVCAFVRARACVCGVSVHLLRSFVSKQRDFCFVVRMSDPDSPSFAADRSDNSPSIFLLKFRPKRPTHPTMPHPLHDPPPSPCTLAPPP